MAMSMAAHFAKRNTKNCGGGTPEAERFAFATEQEARAGKNSFPPTLFLFARPSGKVFVPAERSAAIKIRSPDFRQKKFGF